MNKTIDLYINPVQAQVLNAKQPIITLQAGRGVGKTTIRADRWAMFNKEMPRSKGFILGKTYKMIENNFLPEIFARLEKYGFKEHISNAQPGHYVIGKKPPANWWQPLKKPRQYENIISFFTGLHIYMMSFDRPDTLRGGSFDWGDIDEASLIDFNTLKKTVIPLIRGNVGVFKSKFHGGLLISGSMPWTDRGRWIIEDMPKLAEKYPDRFKFIQGSALDNIEALGQKYIDTQRQLLDPITFDVEIMNNPPEKLPNAYYEKLKDKHTYYPVFDVLDNHNDNWLDLELTAPLIISFDFNAAFNSCIIAQDHEDEFRIIDNSFVKDMMFQHLVDQVTERYSHHHNKHVLIYGGKDGKKGNANSDLTYYEQIQKRFKSNGWTSEVKTEIGLADGDHKIKHMVMNAVLSEANPHIKPIRINEDRCKDLLFSMRNSPIKPDFKKDKSSESANIPQEKATHLSDCFDNLIYPRFHMLVRTGSSEPLEVRFQ
jgi:hypothetical protein